MGRHRIFRVLRAAIIGTWLVGLSGLHPLPVQATTSTVTHLPVAFASAGPCSVGTVTLGNDGVSSAQVTLTGAGNCAITASQAGDATYAPASNVVRSFMVAAAPTQISLGSIASTPYGDPVTLSATVTPTSISAQPLTGTVTFSVDAVPVGSAAVNSSGVASISPTVTQAAGSHAVTASFSSTNTSFAGSSTPSASSLVVSHEDTTLTYTGDSSGDYHDGVTLKATLLEDATKPIPGRSIVLTLGSQSCIGTTGSDGVASCPLTLTQDPASVSTVSGSFAGDTDYSGSATGSQPFSLKKEESSISYTGATQFAAGSAPAVSALLKEDTTTALSGKRVTITIGSGTAALSCGGTTDSSGTATCTLPALPASLAKAPVATSFTGDTDYLASSDTSQSVIVFGYLPKGAFVIGDTTAQQTVGATTPVTFWSAQWSRANSLSGGTPPSTFFGFARTLSVSPPTCGSTWSTTPGASSLLPPINPPIYMAVLVASRITLAGTAISGNITRIGIVQTRGTAITGSSIGTGPLVATFCPTTGHLAAHRLPGSAQVLSSSGPVGLAVRGTLRPAIEDMPASRPVAPGTFRYAPRPRWHPSRHGQNPPVTRLARGMPPTRHAMAPAHRLRPHVTGTTSQTIQFDPLADKTFGNASFTITATSVTQPATPGGLPPDPSTVAPPLDETVATTIGVATAFLYTGPNPIQTGVAPGTINPLRVCVLRGRVLDSSGNVLTGVTISILNHSELGQTLSRADGKFDLAVNGGGFLTVTYTKDGYLPSQRQVNAPWQQYSEMPDVVLLTLDPNKTTIDLTSSTSIQVAQGSPIADSDSPTTPRQATLFFAKGTTATMTLPGGTQQSLSTLTVRATEYTVGANGPAAMPGELPPTSGYTYATEFSVDEAQAAGATSVQFNQPVINYVQNFLNFPVGMTVPVGSYDKAQGKWMPEFNGRVIKILSRSNGMADLDVDGSGTPALAPALAALGITDAERTQLAVTYADGTTLWRTPLSHFSPWDCNWPVGPPPGAGPPPGGPPNGGSPNGGGGPPPRGPRPGGDPKPDPCKKDGSVIGCLAQSLGENIGVTGTPFTMHYESERSAGVKDTYTVTFPVSGPTLPGPVLAVEAEITIGGRYILDRFAPSPNQTYTFTWDGKDSYGRLLNGSQPYTIRFGYAYHAIYMDPADREKAWASVSGVPSPDIARQEIVLWQYSYTTGTLGTWRTITQGLGGWTLDAQHEYDPNADTVYFGNGDRRNVDALTFTGSAFGADAGQFGGSCFPSTDPCGDGGPAIRATFGNGQATNVAVDAAGAQYITDYSSNRIRKVGTDGIITTVAGSGVQCASQTNPCGDGGPATQAQLFEPAGLAVAADGTLYIADAGDERIRRVAPSGIITTVAGNGTRGFGGDGGPGTQAELSYPEAVSIAPDGSLYIADFGNDRIRRLMLDGTIETEAGVDNQACDLYLYNCFAGDNGPAGEAHLYQPSDVVVAPDGSVYIADTGNERIRRIGTNGIITTFAGDGTRCVYSPTSTCGDGGLATQAGFYQIVSIALAPDHTLYVLDHGKGVRAILPSGIIQTVAGNNYANSSPFALGPAGGANLGYAFGIAVAPDSRLLISNWAVFTVGPSLSGLGTGERLIPSADGSEVYVFDPAGRHLRTLDAVTGALHYRFLYASNGFLARIIDGDGNTTTIQRDGAGNPTAILAPGGQRTALTLDANGYLASIADPAGDTYRLTTGADGQLASLTDPRGNLHTFQYDTGGRLTFDGNPAGGSSTLVRTEAGGGSEDYSVAVTSAEGRTTTYAVNYLPTGERRFTTTSPTGAKTILVTGIDGVQTATYPDGTVTTVTEGPDPRWGMLAPMVTSTVQTTPGGLTKTVTHSRTVTLADSTDPLSMTDMKDTVTANGRQYVSTYTSSTRTRREITPSGRYSIVVLDSHGRISSIAPDPYVDPITSTYDSQGKLSQVTQGDRTVTYTYNAGGLLTRRVDAAGNPVSYGYDAAGRLTSMTLPNGAMYHESYDANGNATSVTMPSGAVHSLGATAIDQLASYTPPGNPAYTSSYTPDGALQGITMPTGRTENYSYDGGGRPIGFDTADGSASYGYADSTDRPTSISRTAGGNAQSLSMTYDGALPTTAATAGATQGQYAYTYNSSLLLSSMQLVSGSDTVTTALTRDPDNLVSTYGPFTFARYGPGGTATGIGDGTLNMSVDYDSAGRTKNRGQQVHGVQTYLEALTYTSTGLISQKVETVGGTAHTFAYTYDANGELTGVTRDGITTEQYVYDLNSNRTSRTLDANPAETATYDAQDRLTHLGNTAYTFNADGYLTNRGSDTFQYSTHGELLSATVGGNTVTYTYDGLGRRIARTDSAGTTQYFYGRPGNPFQLTDTRSQSGTLTTLYYDDSGLLYAMQRGSSRYYVATDQVGTPHVVSDSTGAVVKTLTYDSYGQLISDSAPSFDLPIGYAGGLPDSTTGLVHFDSRDYDPEAGRWTARDPSLYESSQENLYVYVANSPVSMRDPTGLFCVGGSVYDGVGGGGEVCFTKEGFSLCAEIGFGVGEELALKPDGSLADNSLGPALEASAGLSGVLVATAGVTQNVLDPCTGTEATLNINAGGANMDIIKGKGADLWNLQQQNPEFPGWKSPLSKEGFQGLGKAGVEGKAALKGCAQPKW